MWWLPAVVVPLVGLVLFVASALQVVSFGPVAAQQAASQTREFRPALADLDPEHGGEATVVRLPLASTPGRPQDEIPIPPNARLIANSAHGDETAFHVRMALEADGQVADLLAFYRDELPLRGWEEVLMWRWRAADAAVPTGELSAFCRDGDGPRLVVAAIPTSPGTSRALIRIDSATPGPCAEAPPGSTPAPGRADPFPTF